MLSPSLRVVVITEYHAQRLLFVEPHLVLDRPLIYTVGCELDESTEDAVCQDVFGVLWCLDACWDAVIEISDEEDEEGWPQYAALDFLEEQLVIDEVTRLAEVEENGVDSLFSIHCPTPVVDDLRCCVARALARKEAILVVGEPYVPSAVEHLV